MGLITPTKRLSFGLPTKKKTGKAMKTPTMGLITGDIINKRLGRTINDPGSYARNYYKYLIEARKMNEAKKKREPFKYTQPIAAEAPTGSFKLGSMQGKRVSAWQRRIDEKLQELEKKKLHRVGAGENQREAVQNKNIKRV